MTQRFFPSITPEMLTPFKALRSLILNDPQMLAAPECPYSQDTRSFLSEILAGKSLNLTELLPLESPEDLDRELVKMFSDLKGIEKSMGALDAKDKVQWAKAGAALLERIITLRERNLNAKNMAEFQRAVLNILDEVCDPAQRSEVATRLSKFQTS